MPSVNYGPALASSPTLSTFSTDPNKQIPWNFSNQSFFIRDSFPVHLQIAAAFQTAHLLLEPWFRFLIRGPSDKRGREEAEEKGEAREKILIECSPPDNEFSQTIQMYLQNAWVIHYSRFWSVTMDLRNEWWYLFADFISLILLIPLACVPLLIRKQGFPLINWWVSCSALSQISCPRYLSLLPTHGCFGMYILRSGFNLSCESGWLWRFINIYKPIKKE